MSILLKDITTAEQLFKQRITLDQFGNYTLSAGNCWKYIKKYFTNNKIDDNQIEVNITYCIPKNGIVCVKKYLTVINKKDDNV